MGSAHLISSGKRPMIEGTTVPLKTSESVSTGETPPMRGRKRSFEMPKAPPPGGPYRLPKKWTHHANRRPSEVAELLRMSSDEVLILKGLTRIKESEQRVVYSAADVEDFLGSRRSVQGFGFRRMLDDIVTRYPFVSRSRAAIWLRVGRATLPKLGLKDWPMEARQFAAFLDKRRVVQDGE